MDDMNLWSDKIYSRILYRSLRVESYGNFYILSSSVETVYVTAVYPRREDLVSVYLLYCRLRDGLEVMRYSYRLEIRRGNPVMEIIKRGYRVVVIREGSETRLKIDRVLVGMYGKIVYKEIYNSSTEVSESILTIKNYLQ